MPIDAGGLSTKRARKQLVYAGANSRLQEIRHHSRDFSPLRRTGLENDVGRGVDDNGNEVPEAALLTGPVLVAAVLFGRAREFSGVVSIH